MRQAVDVGALPSAEAAVLSGKLPFGPRRWQRSKDSEQDTDQRRREQLEALRLIQQHSWPASRAAERVVAERDARAEAASLGVILVDDPRTELGDHYTDRRISRDKLIPEAGDGVVGAINPSTGNLDLFLRAGPPRIPPIPAVLDPSHNSDIAVAGPADDDPPPPEARLSTTETS